MSMCWALRAGVEEEAAELPARTSRVARASQYGRAMTDAVAAALPQVYHHCVVMYLVYTWNVGNFSLQWWAIFMNTAVHVCMVRCPQPWCLALLLPPPHWHGCLLAVAVLLLLRGVSPQGLPSVVAPVHHHLPAVPVRDRVHQHLRVVRRALLQLVASPTQRAHVRWYFVVWCAGWACRW